MAVETFQQQLLARFPNLRVSPSAVEYGEQQRRRRIELLLRLRRVLARMMDPLAIERSASSMPLLLESGELQPPIDVAFASDRFGNRFHARATIVAPNLLHLVREVDDDGEALTHVMVHLGSNYFPKHHDSEYEVTVWAGERVLDRRLFQKWYTNHSFLLPLHLFGRDSQKLR